MTPGDTLAVHAHMAANFTGIRTGLNQKLYVDKAPFSYPSSTEATFVGGHFLAEANVGMNGSSGSFGSHLGSIFAINPQVILGSSGDGYLRATGGEFDVSVSSGTYPPAQSFGITIVHNQFHAVPAVYDDAAMMVGDQDGITTKWMTGIQFGATGGAIWPLDNMGTIIGAVARIHPSPDYPVAKYGIDFLPVTFTTGGAAFRSPGFTVDSTGVVTSAYGSGANDPTTTNIGPGECQDWLNTMTGAMKRWCNVGGTFKSITYN